MYLKSAKSENAVAQNNLADCYKNSIGTDKNEAKAFEMQQHKIIWQIVIKMAYEWYLDSIENRYKYRPVSYIINLLRSHSKTAAA